MITKNLTASQGISNAKFESKSNQAQEAEKTTFTSSKLMSYTSQNVRANYMPLAPNHSNPNGNVSFRGNNYGGALGPHDPSPEFLTSNYHSNLDDIPESKKYNHPYYDSTINDLNIVMGPDKSAMILREEGVTSELLTHRFHENLKKGKYSKIGLDPDKTSVFMFDANKAASDRVPPHTILDSVVSKVPSSNKKIIFVDHFESFLLNLARAGESSKKYFNDLSKDKNIQIIGLTDKTYINPPEGIQSPIQKSFYEGVEQVEMDGLGVSDTKHLLKTDKRFKDSVLGRYKNVHFEISDGAIDSLVSGSAVKDPAPFPAKALRVLDYMATAKLKESKAKLAPNGGTTKLIITEPDTKKFFFDHSNLLASATKDSRFKLAESVTTRLSDVGGIKEIKEDINDSILSYIKDPKKFLASGQVPPKGKLLVGEPGTGKTLLARAIAGEAHVPFIAASGSEFVEKYVGVGAQRMRELFDQARKAAAASEKKTAIIFIDEIDAFGKKRTGESGGSDESEKTLNQLLTEMDGFNNKESKTKVIVLAATNRADVLDSALKRPGRFDDIIEVPAPSRNLYARLEILQIHSRKRPFASEAEKTKILTEAAKITRGMSGAELAEVMNKASKIVAKRPDNKIITHNDVVEGFLQVTAGPIKKSDSSEAEKIKTVRHEGGHAVVLDTLKKDKISFITLDERGEFLGAVFRQPSNETPTFKSVVSSIATSYAGGIAEPNFAKDGHGAGVSGDLENVTGLIDRAVNKWGLGVHTPQLSIDEKGTMVNAYSKERKKDTKLFSETGHKVAQMITDFHKGFLDSYVDKYKANAGKGGNNLSGEEFSKMREQWVKDNGKEKEFAKLQKKASRLMDLAFNSNNSILDKLLYKVAMNKDKGGKLLLAASTVASVVLGSAIVLKNAFSKKNNSKANA